MKKKLLLLVVVLTATMMNALAATNLPAKFADLQAALPSGETVLPPPPEVGSEIWQDDSIKYFQYKEPGLVWDEENGWIPNYDSIWAIVNQDYYFILHRQAADTVMDAPFISITWKDETKTKVQSYTRNTTDFPKMNELEQLCEAMKSYHTGLWRTRLRPFCYFDDWYGNKKYDHTKSADVNNNSDSYPSGHAYFRGLFGKCMEYIDPEHNDAIQAMMEEWLHCRLQRGAHWNTDLDAGKQLGVLAFEIAMRYDNFRQLLFETRQELKAYRGELTANPEMGDYQTDIETALEDMVTAGGTTDFTINRTLYKDGAFNTLCLPFNLPSLAGTPLEGGNLYEFQDAEVIAGELSLNVTPASGIVAGRPYLISWPAGDNIYSMTFEDVTITAYEGQTVGNPDGIQFVGTLGQAAMTTQTSENFNQLFLGADNTLYWPNANNSLKGFRAYFLVNNSVVTSGAPARIVMRDNGTTAIDQTPFPSGEGRGEAYKLLRNGRLVIIKNGTRYNAQGQMIK